ncbi:hypothetical protein J437_LFUL011393 [Ladona fulva]|uniref:Chitin-binding type-2 domain-containing protein n=1 Tax=Ladona fulva TaxID=123851 RepID=A0A8K0KB58_LADFU|nr:hypothetical protein J437_LFUL011393 [Ladona fulva]
MNISFAILIALCGVCRVYSETLLDPRDSEEWPRCELGGTYNLPHSTYCDRFFICSNGNVYLSQCDDGLAYIPYKGCALLHTVDCSTRPDLQTPKGSGNCPRLNGLYKDYNRCGQFFRCTNGTAFLEECDPQFVFDDFQKICRNPTEEERRQCFPETYDKK